ncbi:MAG: hypothetical protein IKN43_10095 [Selenomonadaceae bacterium]|nr:hypothetical protein [Selenomonadaceae bacterium]
MNFWKTASATALIFLFTFSCAFADKPFKKYTGGAAIFIGEVACYGEHELQAKFLDIFRNNLEENITVLEQQEKIHCVGHTGWLTGTGDPNEAKLIKNIHMDVIAYGPLFEKEAANAKMIRYAEKVFGRDYFWNESKLKARKERAKKPYKISPEMTEAAKKIGEKYGAEYLFFCNMQDADMEIAHSIFNATDTSKEERPKHIRMETYSFLLNVKTGEVYESHLITEKTGRIQNLFGQYGKAMTTEKLLGAMFDMQSKKIVKDVFGNGKDALEK